MRWTAFLCLVLGAHVRAELAISLTRQNFTSILGKLQPDTDTVVEFYASWCPACRHFRPTYEQVAAYFVENPTLKPTVAVARFDCAVEFDTCSSFNITAIPMIIVGKASSFVDAFASSQSDRLSRVDPAGKDAPAIVDALGGALGRAFTYTASSRPESAAGANPAGLGREQAVVQHGAAIGGKARGRWSRRPSTPEADVRDIIAATVLVYNQMVHETKQLHQHRESFLDFWVLVEEAHPDAGCRQGASELLHNLEIWWPPGAGALWAPSEDMRDHRVCQQPAGYSAEWHQCRGSKPDSRGFTCGLWMLLHSLAAGVRHKDGAQTFMRGLDSFIRSFFLCQECRKNFLAQLSRPEVHSLGTRHDAVIWLWRAHNRVNARIAQEEASRGDGDPEFPKIQFPGAQDCPHCFAPDGTFNEVAVYEFLNRYYHPQQGAGVKAEVILDQFGGVADRHVRLPAAGRGGWLRGFFGAVVGSAAAWGLCFWCVWLRTQRKHVRGSASGRRSL